MRILWADDSGDGAELSLLRCGKQKSKKNGLRAVRYEGNDEAYAVNELYLKIKERVEVQKSHQRPKREGNPVESHRFLMKSLVFKLIILTMAVNIAVVFWQASGPSRGYYAYQGNAYYYDRSDWYEWDDGDSWDSGYDDWDSDW